VRTRLSDAAVDTLLALPALTAVWLWESGISPEAVTRLRAERPALQVDAGDDEPAEVLELEPEPVFTSDATPVDAPEVPAGLEPVNTTCPVSGSPVNPKYTILYEGRVIGFCCPNCPKQFWADPESFLAKVP
jgi:YHS domain-containing protein